MRRATTLAIVAAALVLGQPARAAQANAAQANANYLSSLLAHEPLAVDGIPLDATPLRRFYAAREFRPAWSLSEVHALIGILRQGDRVGLNPAAYPIDVLNTALVHSIRLDALAFPALRHETNPLAPQPADPPPSLLPATAQQGPSAARDRAEQAAAELDLLASDTFLHYAADLAHGRIAPTGIDPAWDVTAPPFDPVAALTQATAGTKTLAAALAALAPPDPAYRRLEQALDHYRAIARRGGWPRVPSGATLKPGMREARVEALRRRLDVAGKGEMYAPPLVRAVRRFQSHNGLRADGVVGPTTLAALNLSIADRIMTLDANLERWRWLPRDLGSRYVMVNIAAQKLTAITPGLSPLAMRAVVGAADKPTPLLISRIRSIVFAPSWYVPRSIAVREILPKLQHNPLYLESDNLRIRGRTGEAALGRGVDWGLYSVNDFPFQLMQLPGARNALGRVKFRFANAFDVYMHDTPEHRLFTLPVRDLSHGCVRLEQPGALALWLLSNNKGWDAARVAAAMAQTSTDTVLVRHPVPVYLLYFTAWVAADGTLEFRPDLYGWDGKLEQALRQQLASRLRTHAGAG